MLNMQAVAHRFRKAEGGNVAMIFGLTIVLLFLCAGMGMDFARAHQASTKAANAIDTATLAAAKAMREDPSLSDGQLLDIAQKYFDANIVHAGRGQTTWGTVTFPEAPNRETGTVKAAVSGTVGTYFARVAGPSLEQISVSKSSTVNFSLKDIELAMALDVTGSMCEPGSQPCTSGPKISALKNAAKDLVDILMPDAGTPGRKVRIGMAPYAPKLRLQPSLARAVTNNASSDCVVERPGAYAFDDAAAGPSRWIGTTGGACINAANVITPLTEQSQKAVLKAKADALFAQGGTAGHIGLAWAWYMISPEWNTTWNLPQPVVAYKDPKTIKAVLLMTDGKFNTQYYNGMSSDAQARRLCDAMKDGATHDVIVYTIGFQLDDPGARALLRDCATTPGAPHFFEAENEEQLRQAFRDIGTSLNNLRLTE